ncbi:MAG: HD domain-containing protein [Ruminococcaceae bacterium]|nr:HD domain-containing protein [Oscillospiraceae bacterium]
MNKERFEKQLAFILEADKEKNIFRQTHLIGYERRENDAEHAWHMAMMIYLLKEYANEEFDVAKAMMMALVHDIVEIDAGDTYAYDTKALQTQKEREEKAADRLFGMLPEDQRDELRALFEEFEAGESAEARFARVMDNFQPLLLNHANDGADWRAHEVKRSQVFGRQQTSSKGSTEIWNYTRELIDANVEKGNIIEDRQLHL